MKTADAMYEYRVENKYEQELRKKTSLKHFKLIEENLEEDEEVSMTFMGFHNYKSVTDHVGVFAYALTDKRMMFAQKKLTGTTINTVLFNEVNDVSVSEGKMFGLIRFDTVKESFNVAVDKNRVNNIHEKMKEIIFHRGNDEMINES